MTTAHQAYLFSFEAFWTRVASAIDQLRFGKREEFDDLVAEAANSSDVAEFLWSTKSSHVFDREPGDPPAADHVKLMALLASHLTPLPLGSTIKNNEWLGWVLFSKALEVDAWSEIDIRLLLWGRSLCDLLAPDLTSGLSQGRFVNAKHQPWCAASIGWLGQNDLAVFKSRLETVRDRARILAAYPERFHPLAIHSSEELTQYIKRDVDHYLLLCDESLSRDQLLAITIVN